MNQEKPKKRSPFSRKTERTAGKKKIALWVVVLLIIGIVSCTDKPKESYAYLLVVTDMDVSININGEQNYSVLMSSGITKLPIDAGDNFVEINPLDGGTDGYMEEMLIEKRGNYKLKIKLGAKRLALKKERLDRERWGDLGPIIGRLESNMIYVEGGSFMMGCTPEEIGCSGDEHPRHEITLSSYYISKYEVTKKEFGEFVRQTDYKTDAEKEGWSYVWNGSEWNKETGVNWRHNVSGRGNQGDDHPVIRVSWNDAVAYSEWLSKKTGKSYRLPTEAEWEYASRGGNQSRGYLYSGSNKIDLVAWYDGNSGGKTHAIGEKRANELGLYDMTGNVWEWCSDWYGKDYYNVSKGKSNPIGPTSGTDRVRRGGSWYHAPKICRVAFRSRFTPSFRFINVGFRVVSN